MSNKIKNILTEIYNAFLWEEEVNTLSSDKIEIQEKFLEFWHYLPIHIKKIISLYLFALEYGAFLFDFNLKTFTKRNYEEKVKLLQKLRTHRFIVIRGLTTLMQTLILVPYYTEPGIMEEIHYKGFIKNYNKKDLL